MLIKLEEMFSRLCKMCAGVNKGFTLMELQLGISTNVTVSRAGKTEIWVYICLDVVAHCSIQSLIVILTPLPDIWSQSRHEIFH